MSPADWKAAAPLFYPDEFRSEYQGIVYNWAPFMARELISPVYAMRKVQDVPYTVTSSGRPGVQQSAMYTTGESGTDESYHEKSPYDDTVQAMDFKVGNGSAAVVLEAYDLALMQDFEGIGLYEWGGLHVDQGTGWADRRPSRWVWTSARGYEAATDENIRRVFSSIPWFPLGIAASVLLLSGAAVLLSRR